VVCAIIGNAKARPANSSAVRDITRITRRVLLMFNLGAQFCFMGEVLKRGYKAVNF
jgi:hypothetical protein